ncbi:MAG TPA: serine hydrolase domain-containing protein [Saprospiraceae bacterium]|nr:serine hydrolase domain-containing protein [Saprospiraceae bacterium]
MQQIIFPKTIFIATIFLMLLTGFPACEKESVSDPVSSISIEDFETRLDNLRKQSNIPGMVAGIVKDGQVIWTKTYGYENRAYNKLVSNATIFHLASLTKTFASTLMMQLVSEHKIDLNAPVSDYGINLNENGTVRVIHLLTHTSQGIPGGQYQYNGDRYALLSDVIQSATGESFDKLATEKIILPLDLQNTAPSDMRLAASDGFDTIRLKQNIAQGYNSNGIQKVNYPKNFSTAAGLISNIDDMLKYAASFDGNQLLADSLKEIMFSPMVSNDGKILPYGLGWFIQQKEGVSLTWHYGYWIGMSSLMVRAPEKNLSFVLLANSDMLSAPYPLANGDIWVSPYAKEFLKSFVLPGAKL